MSIYIFILIFMGFHFIKEFFPLFRFFIYYLFLFASLIYFSLINPDKPFFITISFLIYFSLFSNKNLKHSIIFVFPVLFLFLYLNSDFENLFFYQLTIFLSAMFINNLYTKNQIQCQVTKELLLKKSKELSVIRKTSLLFQKTLDYDELIEILLKTLTSIEGLNFDRAIIFLFDERMNEFIPYYLKDKNFKKRILLNSEETPKEYTEFHLLKI